MPSLQLLKTGAHIEIIFAAEQSLKVEVRVATLHIIGIWHHPEWNGWRGFSKAGAKIWEVCQTL